MGWAAVPLDVSPPFCKRLCGLHEGGWRECDSSKILNYGLHAYRLGSGQSANKLNISVFFSPNCGASIRVGVRNALQIQREACQKNTLVFLLRREELLNNSLNNF